MASLDALGELIDDRDSSSFSGLTKGIRRVLQGSQAKLTVKPYLVGFPVCQ